MRKHLEHLLKKQYVYGYMVFFNMNICRNNTLDIRQLTEYAHDHRIATDYHINETPMLEQDEHFKHLSDNPTYIRPDDWPEIDSLVDWLVEKNKAGYQMVKFGAAPAGNQGLHPNGQRARFETVGLER